MRRRNWQQTRWFHLPSAWCTSGKSAYGNLLLHTETWTKTHTHTHTHTHEGGINIKTGTWSEFCLLLSVACRCSLIISYALSSVGIHIWAINSNLTVSVSPTHMHRHIVGVFVWPSAEGGNRSRFLDFCNFILGDCALSTKLVQPQWQKGPAPVFMCVYVALLYVCGYSERSRAGHRRSTTIWDSAVSTSRFHKDTDRQLNCSSVWK